MTKLQKGLAAVARGEFIVDSVHNVFEYIGFRCNDCGTADSGYSASRILAPLPRIMRVPN